jgi:hypothetical protein
VNGTDGRPRVIAGHLRYQTPPDVGTVLGPKAVTREYAVVLGQDDDGRTVLGYATPADIEAVAQRRADELPPRSLAEMVMS